MDTLATDHVHRALPGKQGGIWAASPGCPGLETLLPVLLSEGHHKRGLPLERVAQVLAANPARLMGLGDQKGAIAPGLDADLAVVDLNADWIVQRENVRSSAGYSIYEGWRLRGRVVHTVARGALVFRDGQIQKGLPGRGRYVRRSLLPSATARR